jgi:hypothetical protein
MLPLLLSVLLVLLRSVLILVAGCLQLGGDDGSF